MKKTLLYLLALSICLQASPSLAEKLTFTTYYPAPAGNYQDLLFKPKAALPSANCPLGNIYANATDNGQLYFCGLDLGLPKYMPFPGVWTLSGTDMFLTDTTTPDSKKVGIGTLTPDFKLSLANDGGIYATNLNPLVYTNIPNNISNSALVWHPSKSAFRAGFWNSPLVDANIGIYSLAMGYDSFAQTEASSVWGGQNNSISGGVFNYGAVITGGLNNQTSTELSQILGGEGNNATGISARVAGQNNIGSGDYSTVGGSGNVAQGLNSTITGGTSNTTNGNTATIAGGVANTINGDNNTISGGGWNSLAVGATYTTISGGSFNSCNEFGNPGATHAVVGGGERNRASGNYSTVSGGKWNFATHDYGTISGGISNTVLSPGIASCITGGTTNQVWQNYSAVIGGEFNFALANYAMTAGGYLNSNMAPYSLVAGRGMSLGAMSTRSFVWGYSDPELGTSISSPDSFIIYSGRMGIRDLTPSALLEINGNGSADDYLNLTSTTAATAGNVLTIKNNGFVGVGVTAPIYPLQFANGAYVSAAGNFLPSSSREYKENISELSIEDAVSVFTKLEPVQYKYNNQPDHQYLGFLAEDVPDLIATQDRKGLASMDIAAVLTKVVSQQQEQISQQKIETEKLLNEIRSLKIRLKDKQTEP